MEVTRLTCAVLYNLKTIKLEFRCKLVNHTCIDIINHTTLILLPCVIYWAGYFNKVTWLNGLKTV